MTVGSYTGKRFQVSWVLVFASAGLSVLLLTTLGSPAFREGIAGMALLAATCMAVGDVQTGKLRNAWTVPFAAAAMLHVLIDIAFTPTASDLAVTVLLTVGVNSGVYLAMGLAGWVGFGDVKFVFGLTLIAVVLVGPYAMLLPIIALLVAAITHAVLPRERAQLSARPHAPAIVFAFVLILTGVWLT